MPLCGSSTCGCAIVSAPAAAGEINGILPTIDVAGSGTTASPWNLTLNPEWVAAFADLATYVPTLTQSATVTKTVTRAAYWRGGAGVHGDLHLVVTGTGTAANAVVVGLPVDAAATYAVNDVIGEAWIFDTSAGFYYFGVLAYATVNTAKLLIRTAGSAATFLGTTSFTAALAVGDIVSAQFAYEPA